MREREANNSVVGWEETLFNTRNPLTMLFLSILLLGVTAIAFATCPIGSVQGLNHRDCYLYVSSPSTWFNAEEQCLSRNGHLASVSNGLVNAFLQQPANLACAEEYWLGGSYDLQFQNRWTWTDESRFSYTNWASGKHAQELMVKNPI